MTSTLAAPHASNRADSGPALVVFTGYGICVATWLPRQEVAYGLAIALIGLWLLRLATRPEEVPATLWRWTAALTLFVLWTTLIGLAHGGDILHPSMWLFTHASLGMLLFAPAIGRHVTYGVLKRFVDFSIALGLVESVVGLAQVLQSSRFVFGYRVADVVIGTLGANSHLYAIKMLTLAFAAIYFAVNARSWRYALAGAIFILSWLSASALHTVVVVVAATGILAFMSSSGVRQLLTRLFSAAGLLALVLGILALTQERAYQYMINQMQIVNLANPYSEYFGKIELVRRTVVELPADTSGLSLLTGTGAGTYSSRASWILSGVYLSDQSYVPVRPSRVWERYLQDLGGRELTEQFEWMQGVANLPVSSWVSAFAELGVVLLAVVVYAYLRALWFLAKLGRSGHHASWAARLALLLALVAGIACGFDNWAEYPRFMLPTLYLIVLAGGYSLNALRDGAPVALARG